MKPRTNGAGIPAKVLVISDQGGFSRDVIARWQMQAFIPEFTALRSDLWQRTNSSPFEIAIAGDVKPDRASEILGHLHRGLGSVVYVTAPGESVHALRRDYPRVITVPRHDAWLDTLVLVCEEILKRTEVSAHIDRLEQNARANQRYAALGKYMLETRHNFNNALTSVLGNAELLLLESAALSPSMREQLETLHSMTLRLHEMMQRFTSIEWEMQCADRSSRSENAVDSISAAAGI
jgi:signal transduction histidine kinase